MIKHVGLMSMKQKMEKMISTLRERAKRTGIIRKTVGLGLALMMVIETPSWSGLIRSALAHEDKVGSGRCIYVDTSLIGADSDVMESGIGAYVYNRDGGSYSDAPIIMEKVEGKRNVYQLVLDDYYTYVEFTKGSDLNTGTKTGALAIDWSLGSPCYMFNSEALSDGGHFYGLYTVYFDLNGAPDASAFADNGVGVYAYNSDEDSYTAVPVAMKASGKGDNVYEYSLDGPYDCIAFMGGYGSWNYEVATAPVYMDWSYSAPCFFLEQVDGHESTGVWRNLRYTVYFDASDIKDDEAFIENGVWLYAFNDSDDKLSEDPVKMVASSVGSYIYEYTMERPYENLQFVLGDSLEAEVSSQVLVNDWMTYAEPCYKMTLDRKEILMASPSPSMTPSASPSGSPSPSVTPSMDPSASPSGSPSATPSTSPSADPSASPSGSPSATPSMKPSTSPDVTPSATPSANPTATPSANPTEAPTTEPTEIPTIEPTEEPTTEPTSEPTQEPEPAGEATPEPVEEATPEPVQDSEEDQQDTTSDDSSSDEQSQTLDQARAAAELTVTYGSYKMIWVGTEGGEDIEPITNTIESEESGDTDEEEPSTPENPPTVDESTDSETTTDTEEPEAPDTPADDSDENPTPAPTTGGEEDGEPMPSDNPDMISASPSATPIGTDDEPVVETTMSLLSSTGATMMFQRAAALSRSNDSVTIYFDTSGNGSWTTGDAYGWKKIDAMFVHFYNDAGEKLPTTNNLANMNRTDLPAKEADGVIWEYTLTKAQAEKFKYVIFQRYQSEWDNDNQQTTNDNAINTIPYTMSRPCFILSSSNTNEAKKTGTWYDLGPLSQSGEKIYFVDMTSQYDAANVEAHFAGNGNSDTVGERDQATGGYIIPGDTIIGSYSTVTFYDKTTNTPIGETYSFFNDPDTTKDEKGFRYDSEECNTFYYGATEKADGTKISTWGARPSEEIVSLAGKKLYFDRLYFQVPKDTNENGGASGGTGTGNTSGTGTLGAQFQIGTETPVSLTADEGDARTYSYTFDGTSTATSQSILTYLDQDGTKYHFFWDEFDLKNADGTVVEGGNNLVTLEDEIARVNGKYEKGNWIYFDATLSKLSYAGSSKDAAINVTIPGDYGVYCWMAKDKYGNGAKTFPMDKVTDRESWKDVWKVNLLEGYSYVRFANYDAGEKTFQDIKDKWVNVTDVYEVPWDDFDDPCFYADSGDKVLYDCNDNNRLWWGGYWEEVYTLRDAEKYKKTDVVNIAEESKAMDSKTLYMNATLYDYYTDYELNGNNRDDYKVGNGASQRNWVTFRQFNQALSDYYEENNAQLPLYTGHFQPSHTSWSNKFADIAGTLNLYGWGNYNNFFYANTSTVTQSGNTPGLDWHYAAQGLVNSTLQGNDVVLYGGSALEPHFNKDFLAGNNSKNAVLGEVYENVSFPFVSTELSGRGEGVKYWVYDSDKTSLELKKDGDEYWLKSYEGSNKPGWSKNHSAENGAESTYGFFPFNNGSDGNTSSTYNFGYGAKLEFKFRLTENGRVTTTDNKEVPIVFEFSGDDDVWVFIDGNLALDIGGPHGAVSGEIDFSGEDSTKNARVYSKGVKSSGGEGESTFEIKGANTDEHTFTMFYMERGMWESNMKITFNFPDENQLAVEKKVDVSGVNPAFQGLFKNVSLFSFELKNQATHYAAGGIIGSGQSVEKVFNDSFAGSIAKDSDANTFESVGSYAGRDNVVHWRARYNEAGGGYRDQRCGIIYPTSDEARNLSDANRYLQFDVYFDDDGIPALNHMYIELVDGANCKISRTLNGVTYGSIDLNRRQWTTITVDLRKFVGTTGFDWTNVKAVRFGYNFEKDIYLDNFIFKSPSKADSLTGFITKQYDIPDYGSVEAKGLVYPKGAAYTLTEADGSVSYGVIGSDGKFALADGESVLFRDQFRRGSYIMLKEIADDEVFDTSWTMYENGQAVKGMGVGDTVINGTNAGLININGCVVDDKRTEVYTAKEDGDEVNPANTGYTETRRPSEDVFVFRSYATPDYELGMTKLKVVYTNTVRTGTLTIRKEKSDKSENLTGTYTFNVTFANVAGMGLENEPITMTFTLKQDQERTITGIPVNTEFTITETPSDKSFLEDVTMVTGSGITINSETKEVAGQITESGSDVKLIFTNMLKPVIDIHVEKTWKNADGTAVEDKDNQLPEYLLIRLQRREKGSQGEWQDVIIKGQETANIKIGNNQARTWEYKFADLDKYVDNKAADKILWEYRVVEVQEDSGNVTVVEKGGIWDNKFQVTYSDPVFGDETLSADAEEKLESTITNIHNVSLKVKKVDASGQPLGGVSFQLQRKDNEGNWKPVEVTVNNTKVDTITTPTKEENPVGGAGVIIFANLPSGEYQLIETATAPGHTLLANPISITINANGDFKYTINGIEQTPVDNTVELTIKNGQNLTMPSTGGAGPIPFTVGGLSICIIASLMYIDSMRKRRKEGKAS